MSSDWPRHSGRKRSAAEAWSSATQLTIQEINDLIEKRLFVARLPEGTTEEELRSVFEEFGELSECRIVTGRNWGFVRYDSWASAHRALVATDEKRRLTNHQEGFTIAVSFAERREVGRGGGKQVYKGSENSRVFARNLPDDFREQDVQDIFSEFGDIETVTLLPAKASRRCAFVTFSIWGEALDAIEALDGTYPRGMKNSSYPIGCVLAEPRKGDPEQGTQRSRDFLQHDEREYEPQYEAKRRRVVTSNADSRHRGRRSGDSDDADSLLAEFERLKVAYLLAMDSDGPASVCDELHDSLLALRPRVPRRAEGRQARGSGISLLGSERGRRPAPSREVAIGARDDDDAGHRYGRLYISGLPEKCTDAELEALVEQVAGDAELSECWVLPSRGRGYVRFVSITAAEDAKDALDGRRVDGWHKPLQVQWAAPKGDKGRGRGRDSGDGSHIGGNPQDEIDSTDDRRVFVAQLVKSVDYGELKYIFEEIGEVNEVRLLQEKGIAYVTYNRASDAREAVEQLDGLREDGISREQGLRVQIADPKR